MIKNIVESIDWKWLGISYVIAVNVFGLVALIKLDFNILINGFLFFSFFVVMGCLKILVITVKNNYR